jgi:hypothetical protein
MPWPVACKPSLGLDQEGNGGASRASRASRACQRAGGPGGLGLAGVGDPDHRGTVRTRRTSMVYQHRRWQGPAGVAADPAGWPQRPAGSTPVGLGTLTTRRSRRLRSGREQRVRRHGGGADEPAPGTGRPSSPSMAGIGPQTVILGDGRHPWPGRHHVWRRRLRTPIPDQLQSNSLPSRSIVR